MRFILVVVSTVTAFIALFANISRAAEIELPAIVKEGSVSDVLMEDPILPAYRGRARTASPSGGLEHGLAQDLPVAIVDTGQPGNLSQIRGLGQSAEETNVQTLGIPLNGPQGGRGFDFSTFPDFIWDDYQYRLGPSLGVFDPAGIAGSLTLHPWTETSLARESGGRVTGFVSDQDLRQFSVGGIVKDRAAILAGYSSGRIKGPSGSFSAQQSFGAHRARFHFLGTNVDALSKQTTRASFDQKNTTRWIPVVQTDFALSDSVLLKNTFYYDGTMLHSIPAVGRPSTVRTSNVGTQNAILIDQWKFGLSAEHIDYQSPTVGHFRQNAFNVQGARAFELGETGATVFEPTARGTIVSGYDLTPEGTLGLSHAFSATTSAFARATFSRKFPTLVDRYYVFPGRFQGNPALKPEQDWTGILGSTYRAPDKSWNLTAQAYSQLRIDGQVLTRLPTGSLTYQNSDTATIHAALITGAVQVKPWLELKNGLTYTLSHVSSTNEKFTFIPTWINVASMRVHESGDDPAWDASVSSRAASWSATGTPGDRTPGYIYFDLQANARVWKHETKQISIGAGVKDLFDRPIEIVEDNPIEGRAFTFSLTGEI